jgi:hypothetical protein
MGYFPVQGLWRVVIVITPAPAGPRILEAEQILLPQLISAVLPVDARTPAARIYLLRRNVPGHGRNSKLKVGGREVLRKTELLKRKTKVDFV